MKRRLRIGVLAFFLMSSSILVLTAGVGVYRCSWYTGICRGECYCVGTTVRSLGLCAFECDEGEGGTCSASSWPYTCAPVN